MPVCGRVVAEDGMPRAAVRCQLCSDELCLTETSGADGSFCFRPPKAGAYHVHALGDAALSYGDVLFPYRPSRAGAGRSDLGDLLMPSVRERRPIDVRTGGTLRFESGAELTVPPGSLRLALGAQTGSLAALAVPLAQVDARLVQSRAGAPPPLAAYLLLPFGAIFDRTRPGALSLPAPALPEGTAAELWVSDYDSGVLRRTAAAQVHDGRLVTAAGAGVDLLAWVLVY